MTLSAQTIRQLCVGQPEPLIHPFIEKTAVRGMSAGLSECGYDIRIAQTITVWPHTLLNELLYLIGRPRPSFVLASTIEHFRLPNHLRFQVVDKSSLARRGIAVQNTQAEPGWCGYLTLELTNHSRKPVTLMAGDPVAQVVFEQLDTPTATPYRGKYQNQPNRPVPAKYRY